MRLLMALPLILMVFVAGCTSYEPKNIATNATTATQPSIATGAEHTVEITSAGFNPNTLTVKLGDKVTFVNKDTAPHWPASAVHPTHCEYKGCGVFDAKKGLGPGEIYPIVFDLAGTWKYHDHLNPVLTGRILVQ